MTDPTRSVQTLANYVAIVFGVCALFAGGMFAIS
jgi:hypothetical protein